MKMNLILLSYSDGAYLEMLREELLKAGKYTDVQLCFAGKKAMSKSPARSPENVAEKITQETLVLPLFLTAGVVYKRERAILGKSGKVRFLPPLLETKTGRKVFVRVLNDIYDFSAVENYILVGHGSEEGNDPLFALQEEFISAGLQNVKIALLHGTPAFETAVSECGEKTTVIPLLFSLGHHSETDIFSRLPERVIPIKKGLLESPRFRQFLINYK